MSFKTVHESQQRNISRGKYCRLTLRTDFVITFDNSFLVGGLGVQDQQNTPAKSLSSFTCFIFFLSWVKYKVCQ
jgi:hypothetical protein